MTILPEQTTEQRTILVIDDEPGILKAVKTILNLNGYDTQTALGGKEGLALVREKRFDLILCDLKMPEVDGLQFLQTAKDQISDSTVIMMSAFGTIDIAIKAMKLGAYDYISKPFNADEIILTIKKAEERQKLQSENRILRAQIADNFSFSNIIGKSPAMTAIFRTINQLAEFNTNILLQGESGTGKEIFARAIHLSSARKNRNFIAVNCAAVPEHLLESELFGHKKGSFTDATKDKRGLFLEADQGTLFLDEIGDMSPQLQSKILRAIQEKRIQPVGETKSLPVDIRIIAATLKDLEAAVIDGSFREDLYYRLNVVSIHIPPLRDRKEDIPLLIDYFTKQHCRKHNLPKIRMSKEALSALVSYNWPGNVRELENCIEHCLIFATSTEILTSNLPQHIIKSKQTPDELPLPTDNLSIKQQCRDLEKRLIKQALLKTSGNRTHAAKILEISHRALLYKIKEYQLG